MNIGEERVKRIALTVCVAALAASTQLAAQPPAPESPPPAGPQPMVRRMAPPPPAMRGDRAVLPADLSLGIPVVTVTVNGHGPYRFGMDTGAQGHARISARLAAELGLTPVGEAFAGDPSGLNRRAIPLYRLDHLTVGGLDFSGVTAGELTLDQGLDGILGIGLFDRLLLTLDYGNARLTAERGALPAGGAGIFDYEPVMGGLVTVPVRIGGFETRVHLDSGAGRVGIALPRERIADLPTRGAARVVGHARTVSQELEISAIDLAEPARVGDLALPVTMVSYPSPSPTGVLGSAGLQGLAVTIDQQNRRLRIVPSSH